MLDRRRFLLATAGTLLSASAIAQAPQLPPITVYLQPDCGCCHGWIKHLRANGFTVRAEAFPDLTPIKRRFGIPGDLESCHTGLMAGYLIEGHVPAAEIRQLLRTMPVAKGLAVPGMPIGSPGMEDGNKREPYDVVLFHTDGKREVFARY
ncbi:MAG: DUF411 domain-containing protein [Alphaproteobacteria bacterium]|nr:DUF411 domain-containing protein [Alphaproteobacteria bacterium]